jgi:uncharacterized membrane protein YhaH (DUF805 family)
MLVQTLLKPKTIQMNYYLAALQNFATFSGRARRSEYWYFQLFNVIITIVLTVIGFFIHFPFLGNIFSLVMLIPTLAVGVRRMHDVGKSGFFILIPIYSLILALTEGEANENQYGPNPKETNA